MIQKTIVISKSSVLTLNVFKKIETTLNGFVLIGIDSLTNLKNKSNIYGRALVSPRCKYYHLKAA